MRLRTSTSGPIMAREPPTGLCTSSACTSTFSEACSRKSCARGAALRERVVGPLFLSGLSLQVEAEALIWAGQPGGALRLLEPLLERMAGSEELQFAGHSCC